MMVGPWCAIISSVKRLQVEKAEQEARRGWENRGRKLAGPAENAGAAVAEDVMSRVRRRLRECKPELVSV